MTSGPWEPDPVYARYPRHDLHEVPLVVLEAARDVLREAARLGDVSDDDVQPLADSVVMAVLPAIREWQRATGAG